MILFIIFILIKNFYKLKKKNLNILGNYKKFKLNIINNNKNFENFFKKFKLIIYFGYSNCPDICPNLINKLIKNFKNLKIIYKIIFKFKSIDFKRDNNEILQKFLNKNKIKNIYINSNNKNFLKKISKNLNLIYIKMKKFFNKFKINHNNIKYLIIKKNITNLN